MKYALILALTLTGCSSIWHNRDYIAQRPVETCPASHLPYALDAVGAVGFGITSVILASNIDLDLPRYVNVKAATIGFGIISTAYLVSTVMGIGEVSECARKQGE